MAYRSALPTQARHRPEASLPRPGSAPVKPWGLLGLLVALSLLLGLAGGLSFGNPMLTATTVGLILLLTLIWHRPVLGLYVLVAGAVVVETFSLGFSDSITDQLIFFRSLSSAGGPGFLLVTVAETILVFALGAVALRRMATGQKPLVLGPLAWAIGLYIAVVSFGLVHGLGTGSNLNAALWEARSQFYIFLVYLLVVNTIQEKSQVVRLFWIFLLGVGFKGALGVWRWLVTLEGSLDNISQVARSNSILAHEESQFFALFIVFLVVLFLFRGHRAQFRFGLLASLPVFLALLANERRSGFMALFAGLLLVAGLAYLLFKLRRRLLLKGALIGVLLAPVFFAATWNTTGIIGQPTRAIKSTVQPGQRDASSNDYRDIENLNLKYNVQINPLLGRGYGHEIILYIRDPDIIPYDFVWWEIIPHNNILWVWMRLGFFGFLAFWFLVGRALIAGVLAAKHSSDPYLKGVAVFAVAFLATWVLVGALDMAIVEPRLTIMTGALIGLISCLPGLRQA